MKRYLIKLFVIISMFISVFTINAIENLTFTVTFENGQEQYGKVQYSINNGAWIDVNNSLSDIALTGDVTNFKVKVVPNEFYEVDFTNGPYLQDSEGVAFNAGDRQEERDQLIGAGYQASILEGLTNISLTGISFKETTASRIINVNVSISTDTNSEEPIEYWQDNIPSRFNFYIGNGNIFEYGQDNLTFKDNILPPNATGVSTTNPVEYEVNYDNSDNIEFKYNISNASTEVTSLIINNIDYTDRCPHTDEEILDNIAPGARSTEDISFNIPYANEINIEVVLTFNDLMGGFGWNYLPEESLDGDTREDCIAHGTLSFVSGEYNDITYSSVDEWNNAGDIFSWIDGDKNYQDEADAWGSAAFPKGAKITMKLIPDEGYQLVSLYGDQNIVAENEVGVYTITMSGGMNSHLQASFIEVSDIVNVNVDTVNAGEIKNVTNEYNEGTMKLNVDEANISQESREGFEDKAQKEEIEIHEYLDLNLANTIFKATQNPNEAWDREILQLENPAEITLELNEDFSDKDSLVIIHEHDDTYETIPVNYDEERNSITFETSSFSNYALGSRSSGTYNIIVNTDGNGMSDSNNPNSAAADETGIMLIVIPDDGYVYDYVEAEGINEDDTNGYSVLLSGWPDVAIMINKMPGNDLSFMVHFAEAVEITYDANGGIPGELWRDTQLIKQGQHEESPFRIFDDLISAPEGKEYDGVIIDGVAYGPDDPYDFNDSVTIVYQWRDSSGGDEEDCIIHFDLDGADPGPYYEGDTTVTKGDTITIPSADEIAALAVTPECKEYGGFIFNGVTYLPGSQFTVPDTDEMTAKIKWNDAHDWGDWKTIKEATETQTGLKRRECKNNPEHYQIEIIPIKAKREVPDTKVV